MDEEEEKEFQGSGIKLALAAILLLAAALLLSSPALAQVPAARTAGQCSFVGEMTMSGRALAKHGVKGEQWLAIMREFYGPSIRQLPHVETWIQEIQRLVAKGAVDPHELGALIETACLMNNGDLNKAFGYRGTRL